MYEEPLHPVQPSFAHGEVSPYLFGRVDLQAYGSGLRTSRNAFIRTEGSWSNRQGTLYRGQSATNVANGTVLIPFTFNVGQTYVIEMGAGTIYLWSQGALINTGTNPYSLADLPQLRYAQSADTLTVVHPNYPPMEFKRTSSVSFTFLPAVYFGGPFLQQNTDGTTFVYSSGQSGNVVLHATAPIFKVGHVGALFRLQQQDLSQIAPWEPVKRLNPVVSGLPGILGLLRRNDGKNYKCVGYPGAIGALAILTGSVAPTHSQGTESDGDGNATGPSADAVGVYWQYTDSGFGIVKITSFVSSTQVTATVQANYTGGPGLLPLAVVGGPQLAAAGPWSFTGDGVTTGFNLTLATATDPNKFLVTVAGVYQSPSLYSLTGTLLVFLSPPANGAAIAVKQITALGQTSYWAFGAFSIDQGYPSVVTYFPDRLIFGATPGQPVGVFASKTSTYNDFGQSIPIVNSDGFTVFLNARQLNAISDLVPLQDIIIGTANIVWRMTSGSTGSALGPLAVQAIPQAFMGETALAAAVLYADSMIYAIYGGRRIRDLVYQFQFDKYVGSELTAYSRHLIPFGISIVKMQYAPDPWGLLYVLRSDGILVVCTYVREQQMIAWSRWDTQGLVDDIAVVPEANSYSLYMVVRRTTPAGAVRYIEQMSQREVTSSLDYKFMDASLTYDGRNTSATNMILTGGTTWAIGDTGTLTASSSSGWAGFASTDVGLHNVIQLFDPTGVRVRLQIMAVSALTVATVQFLDAIPVSLRGVSVNTWTFARTKFSGVGHLASMPVAVYSDSLAIADIHGTPTITVDPSGNVVLPSAGGVVAVGLQYLSDMETLPLNVSGVETLRNRAKGMPSVYLDVFGTRGLVTGTDFTTMYPIAPTAYMTYPPTQAQDGIIDNMMYSAFDSECHVCVRQAFPLPVTIRMLIPTLNVGEETV